MSTRAEGRRWEDHALATLQAHGLVLLGRNVTYRIGELDLVMQHAQQVVFVEVRRRATAGHGGAAASVTAVKRRRMASAAAAWLAQHPRHAHAPCRFDVVAIDGPDATPALHWIRDAFRLDD